MTDVSDIMDATRSGRRVNVPMVRDVTTAGDPAPGWYDDGVTPDVQRWFDGRDWTEHTRPLPESVLRAGLAVRPAGATTAPHGATPVPDAAPAVGWLPTAAATFLPGEPVPDEPAPEPAVEEAAPAWAGASATGWGGTSGMSRFGSPLSAYDGPGGAVPSAAPTQAGGLPVRPSGSPAHWGWRVLASLVDTVVAYVPYTVGLAVAWSAGEVVLDQAGRPQVVPGASSGGVFLAGWALTAVLWFVNRVVVQGRTGQSWGKRLVGLRALNELTEMPMGMWMAFVREVGQIVNGLLFGLGYLWPLWDRQRQTFTDKLTHVVVLRDPR